MGIPENLSSSLVLIKVREESTLSVLYNVIYAALS